MLFVNHPQEETSTMFEVHLMETTNLPSDTHNQTNNLDQMISSDGSTKMYYVIDGTPALQNSFCDIQVIASPAVTDLQSTTSDLYQMTQNNQSVYELYIEDTLNWDQASSPNLQSTTNDLIQMNHNDVSSTTTPPPVLKKTKETRARNSKRVRMPFSSEQLLNLHMEFEKNEYITRQRRAQLSQSLKLTEEQITVWFQNRRNRIKKKSQGECLGVPKKAAKVPKEAVKVPKKAAKVSKQSKSEDALVANRLLAYSVIGNQNNLDCLVDITSYLDDKMPTSLEEDVDWYLNNFQSYLDEMES